MKNFKDKVAVITGGASGVGKCIAFRFGREGAKIVVADVQQDALDKAVAELKAEGIDAIGVKTDVTKYESVEALAEKSFSHFGGVHLLFNNAGVGAAEAPHFWEAPLTEYRPLDDGKLLDLLPSWAEDPAIRRKILVDNPAHLYGFD